MISTQQKQSDNWWGSFHLAQNQSRHWRIGPLSLVIRCLRGEWQLAHQRLASDEKPGQAETSAEAQQETDNAVDSWEINDTEQLPEQLENYARYIFHETTGLLHITPMLPDRALVSRPLAPFNLTAGEEVTLYVSCPLWLAVSVGHSRKKLKEIDIQRPSDTWFGPSTLEGELCYATSTRCRQVRSELLHRPYRAITPVLIKNRADSTLLVERLNIPAPLLSLYSDTEGQLWTSRVILTREKDGDMAALKIDAKAPADVHGAHLLSKPRKSNTGNVLIRAFNAVFS